MRLVRVGLIFLASLASIVIWSAFAVIAGFYGWWMTPIAPQGDQARFFVEARRIVEASNPGNTAFILVGGGDVVAEHYSKPERGIDMNTAFPTASLSKWITALGVMSLVEEGVIDLDDPVSDHLTRWRLPDGPYNEEGVTIRRLLSHTAGLTDGLGFGDYGAEETLPTIEQTLTNPRTSSGSEVKIEIGSEPGSAFAYSGGGYLILQLLIEEVSAQDYQSYIKDKILAPLEMRSSTFEFIGEIDGATGSFDSTGNPAPQYQYAAAGATGFVTTASDLLRLTKAIIGQDAALGLSPAALQSMRSPEAFAYGTAIWGLGEMLYAPTRSGSGYVYGHDGGNEPAINVSVRINPETGDAYIMLANGHTSLASEIGGEWVLWQTGNPDFLSTEKVLRSAALPGGAGFVVITMITLLFLRRQFSSASN